MVKPEDETKIILQEIDKAPETIRRNGQVYYC